MFFGFLALVLLVIAVKTIVGGALEGLLASVAASSPVLVKVVAFAPVMLGIVLAIKLTTRGPAFAVTLSPRLTRTGVPFTRTSFDSIFASGGQMTIELVEFKGVEQSPLLPQTNGCSRSVRGRRALKLGQRLMDQH